MAVWHITESEETLTGWLSFSPLMHHQLQQISHPAKRLEWLASRWLIQQLMQCPPAVSYSATGQPFIDHQATHLSISHTMGYAAVVTSPLKPTGIDIEYPSPRIEKLSARFVNPTEEAQFSTSGRAPGCALVWCAKEAIYKILDTPGILFKEDMVIENLSSSFRDIEGAGKHSGPMDIHGSAIPHHA
ncbi:4'-phosphopantetheinyl transferase family protein [Geofilum rubicundum]|nr:4'-phosphopantetheinyl transferase superfamily protein [Geofilum rubicundum]